MNVIEQAERRRRWRLRRRIACGVVALAGVVTIYANVELIRTKGVSTMLAMMPFGTASAGKAKRSAAKAGADDEPLSSLEERAGLTARGVIVSDGRSTTRYPRRDVTCLARVVYHDGHGHGPEARAAMAEVALNRLTTSDFGTSMCEVVYRGMGRQFGCMFREACKAIGSVPSDTERWQAAITTAVGVLKHGIRSEAVKDTTHFHRSGQRPGWLRRVVKSGEVDGLVLSVERRTLAPVTTQRSAGSPQKRAGSQPAATFDRSSRSGLGGPKPAPGDARAAAKTKPVR